MHRHRGFISFIIILAAGVFLFGNPHSPIPQATRNAWQQRLNQLYQNARLKLTQLNEPSIRSTPQATSQSTTNQSSVTTSHSATSAVNATPILPIMQGKKISSTYYYHYDAGTPTNVHTVFEQAVKLYNATGVVKLRPGKGTNLQNQLAFGTYHKQMTAAQLGSIELGEGGPQLIEQVGPGASDVVINHGSAQLNITYDQSVSLSVSVHELGHALDLDHSPDQNSVMYPIDQGKTALSEGDVNALKQIYQQ